MTTTVTKTIGTAGDYTTLQAWEDAAPANLVTSDQVWQGQCFNQEFFSSSAALLTVSGSTTDATRYKELTTYAGASFVDNANVQTNALRYNASNGAGIRSTYAWSAPVAVNESYFRISKLQILAGTATAFKGSGTTGLVMDKCIVENSGVSNEALKAYGTCTIKNTLLVGRSTGSVAKIDNGVSAYNCTLVRTGSSTSNLFTGAYSTTTLKNCAFFGGATTLASGSSTRTYTTCYTDTSSPPSGCTTVAYDTSTGSGFQNITDATRDFRIKSGSALLDVGTTDSTNAANDIAGTTRPQGSAYDVGAWELAASGAYSATKTETITLADSASNQAALSATATEAATLSHSEDAVIGRFSTISEAMALIESPNGGVSMGGVAAEAMALAETAVNAFGATSANTESALFSDTHSASFSAIVVAAEAMTLAETDSAALSGGAYSATAIEAVVLSHDQAILYGATATADDSAQLADGASNVAALGAISADAMALDAVAASGGAFAAANVAVLDLADARAVAMSAAATAADAMALTDAYVSQLALTAALTTQILLSEISAGSGGSEVTTTAGSITRPARDQQSTRPSRLQASGRPARIA